MVLHVEEGATVAEGEEVALLESMKLTMQVYAPCDGTVTRVCVREGELVGQGEVLLEIEEARPNA